MSLFRLETHRKTSPAHIGRAVMLGVFGAVTIILFVAPLIVSYDYKVLSSGDVVRHSRYPGTVESINGRGEATIRTFDDKLVVVPYDEVMER